MKILTHGNYIHFSDRVTKYSIGRLTEEIEYVNTSIAVMKQQFHTTTTIPIILFINSWGGCLDSALGGCNIIKDNPNPIITVITGQSASAGTMLSVVGYRRIIYPNAYAMVHEGSAYLGGDGEDIEVGMHNMDITEDIVKNLYLQNTILTSKEYSDLCLDDKVWDAKTCIRYGLVDSIVTDPAKLHDWNWLLNITSRKKINIKTGIKEIRERSVKKTSPKKRKRTND